MEDGKTVILHSKKKLKMTYLHVHEDVRFHNWLVGSCTDCHGDQHSSWGDMSQLHAPEIADLDGWDDIAVDDDDRDGDGVVHDDCNADGGVVHDGHVEVLSRKQRYDFLV